MTSSLNALCNQADASTGSFWGNRARGYVLLLLQDRARAVSQFFENCRSALAMVHEALFPLNAPINGLAALMEKFKNREAIRRLVRMQFAGGAETALAIACAHHTGLDLVDIGNGPPRYPDGGTLNMAPYYARVEEAARKIALLVESESDLLVQELRQGLNHQNG